MASPPAFSPSQFYGTNRKQKLRQNAVAKKLEQNAVKLPTAFSHRILGPTNCWKVFYRQTEAFSWARRRAEDVMVFAFEKTDRDPGHATGQRRYLVTSLDVFWHYYRQMEPSQRHHYEIIPEGWPCHLYFDLEFLKNVNPQSDGEKMVELLIQYVCMWLEAVFNVSCDRSCVLDLEASTETKFSRHLIFHIPGAVFVDCVAAGNFVRYIIGLLVKYIKLTSNELNISHALSEHGSYNPCKQHPCPSHQGLSNCTKSQLHLEKHSDFDEMSDEDLLAAAQICEEAISHRCNILTARTDESGTNHDSSFHAMAVRSHICSDAVENGANENSSSIKIGVNDGFSFVGLKNGANNISSLAIQFENKNRVSVEEMQNPYQAFCSNEMQSQYEGTDSSGLTDCPFSSGENVDLHADCLAKSDCTMGDMQCASNEMMRICGQFSMDDLQGLLVSTSDDNKTTFVDLGVYTKNRNFRLYLSSKLNKSNPLVVASRNQFTPERTGRTSHEQAMFNASLVSNIRFTSDLQVLKFGDEAQRKCHAAEHARSDKCGSTHRQDTLEGHNSPSPYPEIDGFIESLTLSHGCHGRVRHWLYFRSSESLLYEITGCRWCRNVQREHRSNNVMYIVDLRQGICYQKCYDPDCQAVGYRSKAMEVPSSLLPSSFFVDLDDDKWEDDMGNNLFCDTGTNKSRISEYNEVEDDKWRRDASHQNELKWKDYPCNRNFHDDFDDDDDDDDDDLLLAALEEVERELFRLPQNARPGNHSMKGS
ncbi:hypothetical protein BsWGS_09318 [Bradybaena similaris]